MCSSDLAGLKHRGVAVDVHDPHADAEQAREEYGIALMPTLEGAAGYDVIIGAVAHREYAAMDGARLAALAKKGALLADIKGMWRNRPAPDGLRTWSL